jgi:peroxiredoxin
LNQAGLVVLGKEIMDNVNRIRVGHFAPDFALKDSDGREVRLSEFRGHKSVLLFFCSGARSASCLKLWDELNLFCDEMEGEDLEILALSLDERWTSHRLKQERKFRFPILKIESDLRFDPPVLLVSQQYGVPAGPSRQKVYPAIFLVDKMGIIRFRKVYLQPTEGLNLKSMECELEQVS